MIFIPVYNQGFGVSKLQCSSNTYRKVGMSFSTSSVQPFFNEVKNLGNIISQTISYFPNLNKISLPLEPSTANLYLKDR